MIVRIVPNDSDQAIEYSTWTGPLPSEGDRITFPNGKYEYVVWRVKWSLVNLQTETSVGIFVKPWLSEFGVPKLV